MITAPAAAAHGLAGPVHSDFVSECWFDAERYADFLISESNVIAAIEYGGEAEGPLRSRLIAELEPLFAGAPRRVTFAGYIQAFQKTT
jgi:hypothetical protein